MQEMSPAELLDVWEEGFSLPPDQKALTLLAAAFPEETADSLAQRSIGQRNAHLLALRERLFGTHFVSLSTCPECGEGLELNFQTADIRAAPPTRLAPELSIEAGGYEVLARLPNSLDLANLRGCKDAADAERRLVERCLLSARRAGQEESLEALPSEVVEKIVETMDQADPQANIQLSLNCTACGHRWLAGLDILAYVWGELDSWARRMLQEVHALASIYGWSERDILQMRPWRRQIYLEMIGR